MLNPCPIGLTSHLDFKFDFTKWLGTDTLASVAVTVINGLVIESTQHDNQKVVAWVTPPSGAKAGTLYSIVCSVTTANVPPRVDTRTIYLKAASR